MIALTEKQKATLLKLADEGMELELLSERYGLSPHTISVIVNDLREKRGDGRQGHRGRVDSKRREEIIAAYRGGETATEAAKRLGTTRNAILGIWHRAGVLGARRPDRVGRRA